MHNCEFESDASIAYLCYLLGALLIHYNLLFSLKVLHSQNFSYNTARSSGKSSEQWFMRRSCSCACLFVLPKSVGQSIIYVLYPGTSLSAASPPMLTSLLSSSLGSRPEYAPPSWRSFAESVEVDCLCGRVRMSKG